MKRNRSWVFNFLFSTMILGLTYSIDAMEKKDSTQSKVFIENTSNWPIELLYKKRGKDVAMRLESKAQIELGKVGELSDAYYGTYGEYYRTAFYKKYPINLEKANPGKDLKVTISTWLTTWTENYQDLEPEKKEPEKKSQTLVASDPWQAFPEAKQYYLVDKQKAYRRIFSLGSKFTQNDLESAYKGLILKWHPDKNPGKEEYATSVSKIIAEAHEALKKYF